MGSVSYHSLGSHRRGYRAFTALSGEPDGFVLDPLDDVVLVRNSADSAKNFCGSLAQALTAGALAYTSPSTKYVRSSGGILVPGTAPRCHYAQDGTPVGILVEPQRTNLLLGSEAPTTQNVTVTATPYTLSFYGTGTVTLSGASTAGPLVGTGASNKVTLTFTPSAGTLTLTVSGTVAFANLEAGKWGTSFIKTEGSSVTRNADALTTPNAWLPGDFNVDGSMMAITQAPHPDPDNSAGVVCYYIDTGNTARLVLGPPGSANAGMGVTSSSSVAASAVQAAASGRVKMAMRWAVNDFRAAVNGTLGAADTSGATFTFGTAGSIRWGLVTTNTTRMSGPIELGVLLPRPITDAELTARTT